MLVQQRKDRKSSSWSVLEAGCLCRLSLVLESWWSPGELRFAFHIGNLRRLDLHSCGNTVDELSGESEGKQAKKKKKSSFLLHPFTWAAHRRWRSDGEQI